ncbi:MAG: hypothetical protein U9R49_10550, partial [Bacteroidota bacterium]|nr:hypothetical protein [Bacteroidota bacterium]
QPDTYSVAGDTITVTMGVSEPGDWIRVVTRSGSPDVKWSQPPDMEFGVNIRSTEVKPIVADDWKCLAPRPVTDVHFWGSYIGWEETNPDPPLVSPGVDGFMIRIYKDVPATPDDYSHPGELLYKVEVKEFEQRYVRSIPHPNETYEHKFYYSLDLPKPFDQEQGTIYWISIAAIMPDDTQYPWGWETSTRHWNDNACRYWLHNNYWEEILPSQLPPWYEEHYNTVDMAFELTVQPPPPPLEPVKWQQRPDMVKGMNIESSPHGEVTVADDWRCLDGSPVSDLHFWGSYPGWAENRPVPPNARPPGVEAFRIQVYSDVPVVSSTTDYSHPGKLLYEVWVKNFAETYVASIPLPWEVYEHKYKYDLDLPRIFWQKRDKIYWLNISAIPAGDYPWGWESSMDRWNDFAVKGWYLDPTPGNSEWEPIIHLHPEPSLHPWTAFIDMSFELTTCEGPIKWLQFPDMANGFNIVSLPPDSSTIPPKLVVADDWLCTNGKPVTEVHFWGSYLSRDGKEHWEQGNPGPPGNLLPQAPGVEKFRLSFHKDVPAGADPEMPWSHPGELIRDVWVDFEKVVELYWDSVPHYMGPDGLVLWEHKFYYIIRLEKSFQQKQGEVYWLDIGAKPKEPGTEPAWYWGWETSKDHWNDNAVRGDGSWWDDLGRIYDSPIDMAFLLITPDDTPYCKGDFDRDGDVDGFDLAVFAADYNRFDCYFTGDCEGDFDYSGGVDVSDLAEFAKDYGRTNCPCALPLPFGPVR